MQLGDLFNADDYPATLQGAFAVDWDFASVEPPPYLQSLNPAFYEQEKARMTAQFEEAARLTGIPIHCRRNAAVGTAMAYGSAVTGFVMDTCALIGSRRGQKEPRAGPNNQGGRNGVCPAQPRRETSVPVVNEVPHMFLSSELVGSRQTTGCCISQGRIHLRHLVVLFPLRPLVIPTEPIVEGELFAELEVVLREKRMA